MQFIKDSRLISEQEWKNSILWIRNKFDNNLVEDKRQAMKLIKECLIDAIRKRSTKKFGILLSGGLDSSLLALICKKLKYNFTCYSVGLDASADINAAERLAKNLGLDHKVRIYRINEYKELLEETIKILGTDDMAKISVGTVVLAGLKFAKENKEKTVFGGLGSEEIFCGYNRHFKAFKSSYKRVHEECWNGLIGMYKKDLTRDFDISDYTGVEIKTPFLDKELIINTMKIHPKLKINNETKKIILRKVALNLGLKEEFALRKKIAAQYGSNFDKAIEKLAKRNGFKQKGDYITSLLDNL
ncbi:asparagine synthase C-terminal domain-containing protein [Candidatus Woesearchaeota archaeon]|nr:asparagine synthase C-terminal domain-containing protein [Candidatus Woesearchaeota archaeon]